MPSLVSSVSGTENIMIAYREFFELFISHSIEKDRSLEIYICKLHISRPIYATVGLQSSILAQLSRSFCRRDRTKHFVGLFSARSFLPLKLIWPVDTDYFAVFWM